MPRPKKTKRTVQTSSSSANGFFSHDSTLRVIGFAADMIAIVTVLFAIKTEMVLKALPFILSPWILFPIWVMAAYTYICLLHSYWTRTLETERWSKKFKVFIVGDLIFRFRAPYMLIPVLLLGIMLVWIAKSAGILFPILAVLFLFCFISAFFFSTWWPSIKVGLVSRQDEEEIEKKKQERIDIVNSRWEELTAIIEKKFERDVWLDYGDFTELFYVWGLDKESIWYAFAKYATEHTGKRHFCNVCRRITGYVEAFNVLVQVERLDSSKYYMNSPTFR
jgi:hypothetical protein